MTENDDDDNWLMQDSPLHGLPSNQSLTLIIILTSPFSLCNIWEIVSNFTLFKQITSLKNIFS